MEWFWTLVTFMSGFLVGAMIEAWVWRLSARDFDVRRSFGKRYAVRVVP